jgi:hypothetical protein
MEIVQICQYSPPPRGYATKYFPLLIPTAGSLLLTTRVVNSSLASYHPSNFQKTRKKSPRRVFTFSFHSFFFELNNFFFRIFFQYLKRYENEEDENSTPVIPDHSRRANRCLNANIDAVQKLLMIYLIQVPIGSYLAPATMKKTNICLASRLVGRPNSAGALFV